LAGEQTRAAPPRKFQTAKEPENKSARTIFWRDKRNFSSMKQKGFINILIIIGLVLLAGIVGYLMRNQGFYSGSIPPQSPESVGCTQEAKQCPDGSYVTREGPNCDFAKCPEINPSPTPNSKLNWTRYREDGTCPPGYIDYGIPLQCVTPEYMEYCKTHPCPICLAGGTLIDTPSGSVPVEDLQIGMPVWTTDKTGQRVSGVITKTSKVLVPPTHQMVHLVLNDGRGLFVSPGHPTIDGRTVGDLTPGDLYDGASVVSTERVPYDEGATYDILPSGDTRFYWANGILIGSTLR
jgi:hypothetical protein